MDPDPQSEIGFAEDGDAGVPSSTLVVSIPPNPARKPTRQWAAWTRQEEENFFNALRQVGKNFEKITCRVQSKNKDQVRHYYYRLVRRMNKLLGPGFGLDAKNSKDTIAAMLRWWSLLEKYSCTASKLHLKPRRFKTFVESLAHQLLKDRNKTRRKRPSHGENFSSVVTTPIPDSGPLNDAYPVKVFLLDGQITQKLGSGKGIPCFNANDSYNKVSSSTVKTVKHKRRASLVASAAYKRWEKAAIAGVSLVADAAEKLEHSVADVTTSFDKVTCNVVSHNQGAAQKSSSPAMPSVNFKDTCCYQNKDTWHFKKLKLQLFPIDDCTRRALEKNDHNPYLELTLSSRKRISSILGHLKHKWENSGLASGELTLLPYGTQHEDLVNCQKWTQKDTVVCAADIYATVGSPSIFRLRYGWFSNLESDSGSVLVPMSPVCVNSSMQSKDSLKENSAGYVYNKEASQSQIKEPVLGIAETVAMHLTNMPERMIMDNLQDSMNLTMNSSQHIAYSSSQHDEQDHLSLSSPVVSASEWADSLTNISIGDLLSEASRAGESIHVEPVEEANVSSLQQATVSSDSFDAAVAAHINDNNQGILSSGNSIASIWDAEDTCDGFAFRKIPSQCRVDSGPNSPSRTSRGGYRSFTNADSNSLWGLLKSTEIEHSDSTSCDRELNADLQPNEERASPNKHGSECSLGLTDLYWPDSLGVLDLGVHSGCLGEDNIFGESISLGLSCLIASSLDAFQNCPFFSIDRRESSSEAQEASMLSKHKVGTDG